MSQQFCLKWNNHMNNMMDVFKNLLSTESMVDVTLACDGLSLKAHKMVLSACSPFFQSLFLENPCKHPIVILKDMKYTELKAIIEFMYHGEVNVAQEQLSALMKTAETLRVKGLAEMPNEKNSSSAQDEPSHRSVPRTETPPPSKRRRGRVRKRSLSDSNRSDDSNDPKIKQPNSPDIEELSGDVTMDNTSGQFSNLHSQVPMQSLPSHSNSYQKSSSVVTQDPQIEEPASADESEFGVEPAKLLEQTLTTDDLQNRRSRTAMSSSMEMQRRPRSSTDHSSNIVPTSMSSDTSLSANQQPESPPDIKPELLELDPPMSPVAGPSHSTDNSMMMYMDQSSVSSHPGTSFQDNSALVPQDSQPQGGYISEVSHNMCLGHKKNPHILLKKLDLDDVKRVGLCVPRNLKEIGLLCRKVDDEVLSEEDADIQDEIKHTHVQMPIRRNCSNCNSKGITTNTFWMCVGCSKFLCLKRSCFQTVHSLTTKSTHTSDSEHILLPSIKRRKCFYCKKLKSRNYCPRCDRHFCNFERTDRECFDLYHEALARKVEENLADEMSSDEMDEDVSHSIPSSIDALQVLDETSPSDFKTSDSRDVSKVSPSPSKTEKSKCISASLHHASSKEEHILITAPKKGPCFYCKLRTKSQCSSCNLKFCHSGRTGRDCFNLYHEASARKGEENVDSISDEMVYDIGHTILKSVDDLPISNSVDSDIEIVAETEHVQKSQASNHSPNFEKKARVCFYCKSKLSYWRCKTCSKSLCVQKSGNTCFNAFHSSPQKAKRPKMKHILQALARKSHR